MREVPLCKAGRTLSMQLFYRHSDDSSDEILAHRHTGSYQLC